MDADAVGPLLFTAWLRGFAQAVFLGRLGEAGKDYWNLHPQVIENVLRRHPEWCADATESGGCDALLAATLDSALAGLREQYGSDMAQWRWGRAHIAIFPHPVFDRIPVLRDWLRVAIPTDGGFDTVNRGTTTIRDDQHPYAHRHGAGFRIVTDLAAPAESRMIIVPGQSGNPLSPHFSDLLQRWRDFDYLVPGRAVPVATLTLEPAQ